MASVLYPSFKEKILSGDIDMTSDTIKVALIDTDTYTYSSTHEFYDDVSGVVGTPATLTSKSVTDGVFDAGDSTFTSVTGDSIEALIIYKDTGTDSTSPLIAYIDSGSGLPLTPSGGDILITWDSGANKIFAL